MATGRYADYFNHSDTADVKVVIEVAQPDVKVVIEVAQSYVKVAIDVAQSGENHARRLLQLQGKGCQSANAEELRAHSVILMGNSPVWKAQLERWQCALKQKAIKIIVEEGEQAAAYRLVQCLYADCLPDIETEVDLRMNLGILMLADQYQVKAALSLCAQKLETLKELGAISWGLADRVMQLPAAYLEKPGFSCLLVKIQEKIFWHVAADASLPGIGLDLEVVMRNSPLEEALMALPLRKCASLLSDDRCRVASENTVAAAVVRRVERERSRSGDGDGEHVQSAELCAKIMGDVIRVPHLSPLFALAMPTFGSQLTSIMQPETYNLGRELDRCPADLRESLMKDLSIPRCWLSAHRPPSTVTALQFDWEASTAQLALHFDGRMVNPLARSPRHHFAGLDWEVQLHAGALLDNGGRKLGLYIFGNYPLLTEGPRFGATVSVNILGPQKESSLHRQFLCRSTGGSGYGWEDFFSIPPMQKWDQSRMQTWTNTNGMLTVCVKVSHVF